MRMEENMRIGFFDSGIGGITVLHKALKMLPMEDYIYYADTDHVPYGEKSKQEVKTHVCNAVEFIVSQGIKALVVACNTATSVAIEDLRNKYAFPVIGMEPAVKPAVEKTSGSNKRVLVFATKLSLKEEKFKKLVEKVDNSHIVDYLPLPELVVYAEHFEFYSQNVQDYLKGVLSLYDLSKYKTVVLGCTHYPYYYSMLRRLLPADMEILDGNEGTIRNLKRVLDMNNNVSEGSGNVEYFLSGRKVSDFDYLTKLKDLFTILDENQ